MGASRFTAISTRGKQESALTAKGEIHYSSTEGSVPWKRVDTPGPVISLAEGEYYALIVTRDDQVYTCGDNSCGQLGLGDLLDRKEWMPVIFSGIRKLVADRVHTPLLTEKCIVLVVTLINISIPVDLDIVPSKSGRNYSSPSAYKILR